MIQTNRFRIWMCCANPGLGTIPLWYAMSIAYFPLADILFEGKKLKTSFLLKHTDEL